MTQRVVGYTDHHWSDTAQKAVDKLGTDNPIKDTSIERIISAF